jgi:predicted  nucleic acid-binding Zn-ribbon protein
MDDLAQIMSKGWTPGAVGIWGGLAIAALTIAGRAALKWIIGMPDRRRAANESMGAEENVTAAVYSRMVSEMERLGKRIESLETRVAELEAENRGIVKERDMARAEVARLEAVNLGRGEFKQEMQVLQSAKQITGKHP